MENVLFFIVCEDDICPKQIIEETVREELLNNIALRDSFRSGIVSVTMNCRDLVSISDILEPIQKKVDKNFEIIFSSDNKANLRDKHKVIEKDSSVQLISIIC